MAMSGGWLIEGTGKDTALPDSVMDSEAVAGGWGVRTGTVVGNDLDKKKQSRAPSGCLYIDRNWKH